MAKFKKLALLCSALMATATVAGLAACEEVHVHKYGTDRKTDATHHWYACEDETCTDTVGKEEHKWNDGEETKAPAVGVDGETTYTCVVCGATKKEAITGYANERLGAEGVEGEVKVANSFITAEGAEYAPTEVTYEYLEAGTYFVTSSVETVTFAVGETASMGNYFTYDVAEAGVVTLKLTLTVWDETITEQDVDYTIVKVSNATLNNA
ncbi:MAG: hypothetical protein IJX88_04825, partial [Clostridia bacterium]|nr:hypothetical protein [Clostridia bacterium]